MRVSLRLALALLVGICGIFAVHTYLSLRFHERLYATDVRRDHHIMAQGLAPAAAALWQAGGADAAVRLLEGANERGEQTTVRWVFPDRESGEVDAPELSPAKLQRLRGGQEVAAEGLSRVLLYFPVLNDGQVVGAIELSDPLETRDRYMRERVLWAVSAAAAMILLGGLLSYILGNRLVGRPVRLLIEKARRIAESDFGGPLDLGSSGEFSELAVEMNAMADQLAAARLRVERETATRISALEQLRHADRLTTVGRLAAGIAHELGTPLNVVSERSKMIVRGETESPEEIVESARVVHEQAARMAAIVRQLLDFARRRSAERSRVDLVELTRSTVKLIEPILGKRGVQVALRPAEEPLYVAVDSHQIIQALTNLLTNAVDVSPANGCVEVSAERLPNEGNAPDEAPSLVRLTVRDQGPGIPEDILPEIFDPFFTTKGVGEGTGLGLSVAQGLVQDNGGRIDVETGPRGTRFHIRLQAL